MVNILFGFEFIISVKIDEAFIVLVPEDEKD